MTTTTRVARMGLIASLGLPACDGGPSIRPVADATATVDGNLTLRPIIFATDDYYFAPEKTRAEQGRLIVPAKHEQPGGQKFEIHFIRFPAKARQPSYPIVYLAGGPGGSGSTSAAGDRFELFMRMRDAADVVALDQRGVPPSVPAPVCPGSWSYPLDRPLDETTLVEVMRPWLERCAQHWRGSLDVSAFNTIQNARDIEALRVALKVEKLNLWGISYGTNLALAYMRLHPGRVHRAILAGIEGPDHTWKLPANVHASLLRIDSALSRDESARRRVGPFIPRLRRALAQLSARPATVEIEDRRTRRRHKVTVGALDFQRALFFAPGERENIQELISRVGRVVDGDYEPLALFAYRTRIDNTNLVMALSTDCAAGATPARRALIASQADTAILGDVANLALRATCPHWPVPEIPASAREPLSSIVSTLFISGTLDNRTPPSNAEEVLSGFPNGHHLTIDGGGHDDDLFLSDERIVDAMMEFLRTGDPGVARVTLEPLRFRR